MRKLSIIVPVYNEAATVGKVLEKLGKVEGGVRREVIVVDDGSNDGSTKILLNLKKRYGVGPTPPKLRGVGNFKFILKVKNEGKGAAIQTALKRATGDYVIIQDADLEYDPREVKKLVEKAQRENLLVVYGSRDREVKNRYIYPHFYWGSKMLGWLMRLAFGQVFTDPETCYKLVQTEGLKFINLEEPRFGVEIEISAKIARLDIPIGEVGISYVPRSFAQGKKIGVRDGIRAVGLVAKYWANDLHYGLVDRWLRRIRLGAAMKEIKFKRGETVVDMGCGRQAKLGWILRERIGRYIGVDRTVPNTQALNIRLVKADLDRRWPRLSGGADKVIGTAIIEHLKHPEEFLRGCRRELKKGGQLVLTTPAPPWADVILRLLVMARFILADEVYDHEAYYNLGQLRKLVEGTGFRVEKTGRFLGGLNNLVVARKP